MSTEALNQCKHERLSYAPSGHATQVGYTGFTEGELLAARTLTGELRVGATLSSSFPRPLVLPGDELAYEPQEEGQTLTGWYEEKERNPVTADRRTIYLVEPPKPTPKMKFVKAWATPTPRFLQPKPGQPKDGGIPKTAFQDILDYLGVFYHGMTVKKLQQKLHFTLWDEGGDTSSSDFIGLATESECVRIRTRESRDGVFARQLNLDDLLDAAISILPHDAYAVLLLVDHDIYEDEEDDYTCGRAYGGSRIAVVSTARYNPRLDDLGTLEAIHPWPASHCQDYMQTLCSTKSKNSKKGKTKARAHLDHTDTKLGARDGALRAAVTASGMFHASIGHFIPDATNGTWLARLCRTASHELGHCLGIDHCVYYACMMQSTASVLEDIRQPPYLCPVDLAKVLHATGVDMAERYRVIGKFCEKHPEVEMFAAFAAWIRHRLGEIEQA